MCFKKYRKRRNRRKCFQRFKKKAYLSLEQNVCDLGTSVLLTLAGTMIHRAVFRDAPDEQMQQEGNEGGVR